MGYAGDHTLIRFIVDCLELFIKNKGDKIRLCYNIIISILLILMFVFCTFLGILSCSRYFSYNIETTYLCHIGEYIYTDIATYKMKTEDSIVEISNFSECVEKGDRVQLKISKINNELIEIKQEGITLYQLPMYNSVIWGVVIFFLIYLGFCIFIFIVVNTKKPKGLIKKLQRDCGIYYSHKETKNK